MLTALAVIVAGIIGLILLSIPFAQDEGLRPAPPQAQEKFCTTPCSSCCCETLADDDDARIEAEKTAYWVKRCAK